MSTSTAPTSSRRSRLCLCLTERTLAGDIAVLERYRGLVDMAELRVDFLDPDELPHIAALPARVSVELILTVRRAAEGGRWGGSERERAGLIVRALAGGRFRYVDLEEDFEPPALGDVAAGGARVIRSIHDTKGVPERLAERVRGLARGGRAVPKVAAMPRGCRDLALLLQGLSEVRRDPALAEWILLGMGEYGFPTRVLATPLGSMLTYCSAEADRAAPGQATPEVLRRLYRFDRISASTRVLGVIGNPVAHSQSPRIHNPGLAALGLDAVYLPFLVDDVREFMRVAGLLGVQGVSVTVPHKLAVLALLSRRDPSVAAIGACNTLVREETGWFGTNTDGVGFLAPLRRVGGLVPGASLGATVIGAGGAARAVAWALRSEGARVLVLNRSPERARLLAEELGCAYGPLGEEGARRVAGYRDLVVQTTTCGMEPDESCDPLPEYRFSGTELVYELVYRPRLTRLVERAQAAGCRWIGGMEMLLEQAYEQFRLFTGREYPRWSLASGMTCRGDPGYNRGSERGASTGGPRPKTDEPGCGQCR